MNGNLSISENIKGIEYSHKSLQDVAGQMRESYARLRSLSVKMRDDISSSATNLLAEKIDALAKRCDRCVEDNMSRWNVFYASHSDAIHKMYSLNWE